MRKLMVGWRSNFHGPLLLVLSMEITSGLRKFTFLLLRTNTLPGTGHTGMPPEIIESPAE